MPSHPAAMPTDPAVELTALAAVDEARTDLDAREVHLVERARQAGATWASIAAALRVTSRQAAEQRFLRLSRRLTQRAVVRQQEVDSRYGPEVTALRRAAADLVHAMRTDQQWFTRFPRAGLARSTAEAALDGPPGALYDLVRQALADIADGGPAELPAAVRTALDDAARTMADMPNG